MSVMKRIGVVASALVLVGAVASPAFAADRTMSVPGGYMKHVDNGDIFRVCDTRADGKGIYGQLWYDSFYATGGYKIVLKLSDGGDAGCDSAVHDIGNKGHYVMTVCSGSYAPDPWPNHSNCTHSAGFNE
ncbi:hypothetical protein [Streptomyces sp. EN27]|uniref:hypothetical protein n=1 Tax=Streptomyces sp. EN27 TaxID=211464 RepID=UPI00114C8D9B|nr:hypothetical protein [Streptomyces sp. EN27]